VSPGAARLCGRCGRVRPISKRAGPAGRNTCFELLPATDRRVHGLRRLTSLQRSPKPRTPRPRPPTRHAQPPTRTPAHRRETRQTKRHSIEDDEAGRQ
jgi:hypothetical protein